MSEGKTHYEVLGLSPDADADQIRKRFRELARKYHPDVNPGPGAHEMFLRINQAYDVLGDATRRASYDLTLRDRARKQQPPPGGRPSPPPGAARAGGSRTGATAGRPGAGGSAASARARAERERRIQEINRLVGYAHQAYRRGQLRDARRYCDQALALGRSGAAYELLGDIALRQDRAADAVRHYTIAAQLMPSPGLVMSKLNRAAARAAQIGGRDYDLSQLGVRRAPQQANRRFYQLSLSCFGVAVVLLLAFLAAAFQGEPLGWPILGTWSLYQLVFMSLAGVVSGALLAAVAWIRPIDQELLFPAAGSSRRGISLGLLTIPLAFLFFPAAVIIYVVAGSIRGTISNSVLVVFAVATAVAFAFMLVVPDVAKTETLMFGGNIVFLTMLFGWLIGDLFRPDWVP